MKSRPALQLLWLTTSAALAQSEDLAECAQDLCFHNHDKPTLTFEPFVNLQVVAGHNGLKESGLAQGAHDPRENGFNLTGLSVGTDLLYNEHFAGYAEGILTWNNADRWEAEIEEVYAELLNLPGDLDIKAGRMFASVGTQNNLHNHAWNFADANLGNVRFLGDDGLAIDGAEIRWTLPTSWNNRIILSYGSTVAHDHDDEHHGHGGDDHGDHSEEAEMALWEDSVFTARYEASFWPGDSCHFEYGASYVQGKNHFKKWSRMYGLDLTYTWLQDEDLGKKILWRNEIMMRDVSTDEGDFNELAYNSAFLWRFQSDWEAGLRYDYLQGVDDPALPERHRLSPSMTRYFAIQKIHALVRLQYNYDQSEYRSDDHSLWLQFGFEWGAGDAHVH